ncbi:MAG: ABC transporter transmembrane domain-containing protein, partial [Chloroflexota bacterium]
GVYARLMAQQQTSGDSFLSGGSGTGPDPAAGTLAHTGSSVPLAEASHVGAPLIGGAGHREGDAHVLADPGRATTTNQSEFSFGSRGPEGIIGVWRRLLLLVRPWWGQLGLTFFLGLAHHGAVIGLGVISALLVGQVVTGGGLTLLLALLGVFVPLAAFFTWAESWMAHDLAYRLLAEMRVDVYNKLDPLAPAYMVRRRSGDLVSIVGGDVETVEYFFAHTITPAFVGVLVPGAVLATLAIIAWPIALVLAPFLLAVAVSPFLAQRRGERLGEELRHQLGDVHANLVDSVQGLREVSAFGQGPARVGEMISASWRYASYQLRFLKERAFQVGFIEGMTALGGLAVLTIGVWFLLRAEISRSQLILATVLSVAAFAPITDIARTMKQLMETLAAARRIFAVHDEPVPV